MNKCIDIAKLRANLVAVNKNFDQIRKIANSRIRGGYLPSLDPEEQKYFMDQPNNTYKLLNESIEALELLDNQDSLYGAFSLACRRLERLSAGTVSADELSTIFLRESLDELKEKEGITWD